MKDTIIIVEGPQGVGKTTFTNYLREKIAASDLYRLTGIKDKTETGYPKIKRKYLKLLEYIENCEDVNMIFDRTFFSEEVYSRLGFKSYSFHELYEELLKKLDNLNFDIYFVVLYLKDTSEYAKRIQRDKGVYQKFSVESSIRQQEEYLKLADEVEKQTKNIKVIRFNTNNNRAYKENIDKQFGYLFK
ncbi:MAG: hypothetical protein J6A29_01565 [Clostridia bacterium]|nr:hypothetical protein [Clostridia bacterium]